MHLQWSITLCTPNDLLLVSVCYSRWPLLFAHKYRRERKSPSPSLWCKHQHGTCAAKWVCVLMLFLTTHNQNRLELTLGESSSNILHACINESVWCARSRRRNTPQTSIRTRTKKAGEISSNSDRTPFSRMHNYVVDQKSLLSNRKNVANIM